VKKNILILSAGRRVELVQQFFFARSELKMNGEIFGADMSYYAPAVHFTDKYFKLPRISSDDYMECLTGICEENEVDALIPTIDTELPVLSSNKKEIEKSGTKILISDKEVIDLCASKKKTSDFFQKNDIRTPGLISEEDIKNGDLPFPLFIKPDFGSASMNTFLIKNSRELCFFRDYIKDPIVMEFIDGDEYTIDCFVDFNQNIVSIVPRLRIETRGGEVSKAKITLDPQIIKETERILANLKAIGPITLQCIKDKTGKIYFIEINPRFGGGAPISFKAGAHSAKYIYRLLRGEKLTRQIDFKDELVALRYDQTIFLSDVSSKEREEK